MAGKNLHHKKQSGGATATVEKEKEKIIDLVEREDDGISDEKPVADPLLAEEEAEEEESGIDDEELNPFGDKWEE